MKTDNLKNPIFISNITDPITNKHVKKIYHVKVSKLNRIVEPMIWEYYKNRSNMSVQEIYTKFKGSKIKIIFFNDCNIYELEI